VHFNPDIICPEEMPAVEFPSPGGLSVVEAAELLRALVASPRVLALVATQFDPSADADGRYASRLVDILASALARHPAA
jgi:arginase